LKDGIGARAQKGQLGFYVLGQVHSRTEDVVAAAEGLFASVCARRVERGLESWVSLPVFSLI